MLNFIRAKINEETYYSYYKTLKTLLQKNKKTLLAREGFKTKNMLSQYTVKALFTLS